MTIVVVGLTVAIADMAAAQSSSTDLKIVSFNIRYGTAADGEYHWNKRREFVIDTIKDFSTSGAT